MNENTYWTSAPDRIVRGSMSLCHLTAFEAPFNVDPRNLPPNDPERARAFVESFEGIEAVLEDLGPRSAQTPLPSAARSDLDIVHAAAWGGMLSIATPAFATDGNDEPLRSAAKELRKRFPDARIVGRVSYHGGWSTPRTSCGCRTERCSTHRVGRMTSRSSSRAIRVR